METNETLQKSEESFFYILVSSRFERNENVFSKTIHQNGQMVIINGQQIPQQGKDIKVEIKYLGEGDIEGTPIYGFELLQDSQSQIVEYFYNSTEMHDRWYNVIST